MAKSKIDETLKKIATSTSKANTPTTSSRDGQLSISTSLGDPNCPYCGGVGYLRADVPVGHPNFGRLEICVCRQRDVSQADRDVYGISDKLVLRRIGGRHKPYLAWHRAAYGFAT